MSESSPISSCPTCGATLPANAPQGLCPKCLLLGVAAPTELDPASARSRPAPPSREAVAAAFPQLEVLELIGQGGMGCVFKARQPQLNRSVALKILPESLARDSAFATRFTREAQALAALSHPNIVTIHDFGQAGGFFYLLMEFVDGVNLRQALRGGRFTPEQALAVVPPLCDALQFAHERGIVHRDIKPENLLLDKGGRIKIADFGIAKMLGSDESRPESATRRPDAGGNAPEGVTGDFAAGTPGYMAPEQKAASRQADSRADIYSLGVVLYEMLTGELPGARLQPPSRTVRIDVRLDEIVLRALEQTPELRYQTAAEFRAQVETLVSSPPGATASPVGNPGSPHVPVQAKPKSWKPSILPALFFVAAICALANAAFCLVKLSRGGPPANAAQLVLWLVAAVGFALLAFKRAGLPGERGRSERAPDRVGEGVHHPGQAGRAGASRGSRMLRGLLFVLALGFTLNFATPHLSVLGDGSIRTWTLGLTTPWFADVQRHFPNGTSQRETRMHLDRWSFGCGIFALATWIALASLQRREEGPALLVLARPAVVPGEEPRIHWMNALVAWTAACAATAVGVGMALAAMQGLLGGAPSPMPAMLFALFPATLVVGLGVATGVRRETDGQPPDSSSGRPREARGTDGPDWPRIMEQVATGGLVIVVGVPLIGILLDAVGYRKGIAFGGGELLLMLLLGGLCLLMRIAAKSILSTRDPVPTSPRASFPKTRDQVLRLVVGLLVGIVIAGAAAYLIVRFINTGWPRQATPEAPSPSASQGVSSGPGHETQPGARDVWRIVEVSAANPWCRWALPRDVEAL